MKLLVSKARWDYTFLYKVNFQIRIPRKLALFWCAIEKIAGLFKLYLFNLSINIHSQTASISKPRYWCVSNEESVKIKKLALDENFASCNFTFIYYLQIILFDSPQWVVLFSENSIIHKKKSILHRMTDLFMEFRTHLLHLQHSLHQDEKFILMDGLFFVLLLFFILPSVGGYGSVLTGIKGNRLYKHSVVSGRSKKIFCEI